MTAAHTQAIYSVGAARVDITPPFTVPYLGYVQGGRHRFFTGVHDPLYARAVVVGEGRERVALVSADAIGLHNELLGPGRSFTTEVRRRIESRCGLPAERVMVAATHAHSTPETLGFRPLRAHPGAAIWLDTLIDQLATTVARADATRRPARLQYATGWVENLATWRRAPLAPPNAADPTDPEVTVLRFTPVDKSEHVVLVHFACHPVTVQAQPLISADYPGAAATFVEAAGVGCGHFQFLQGAGGDVNPLRGATDFPDVDAYGRILGQAVLGLLEQMDAERHPIVTGPVGAAAESLLLPSRPLPSPAQLAQEELELTQRADSAGTEEERREAATALALLEERWERVRLGDASWEAEVQALRLGSVALVGIPGEPFSEMGQAVRDLSGPACARCVGYANGYLGYLAPPAAWEQGGYEVSLGMWSLVGPQAYEMLLQAAERVVSRLFPASRPGHTARDAHISLGGW